MKDALRSVPPEQVWIARLLRAVSADSGVPGRRTGSVRRRPLAIGGVSCGVKPRSCGIEEIRFTRHGSVVGR